MKSKSIILGLIFLAMLLLFTACGTPETPECPECPEIECPEAPECPACPECEACPDVEPCPEAESKLPEVETAWENSGHADSEAEAFRHWDEDDPAVVPTSCGKCHSSAGYLDFHGADGSEIGVVDAEVPAETVQGVDCATCHNPVITQKTSVIMPSGIELANLGDEARCMECHQGRESSISLEARIAEAAGVESGLDADPDTVYDDLGFANIHYYAATATKYGTLAKGGGEYAGKTYDGNFAHVEPYDTCIECHSPHTLEVQLEGCVECHDQGEPSSFRMVSSAVDYDGDDDLDEGIASEIEGLQEILYSALNTYAQENTGVGIVYDTHSYPYFFNDTDGDGEASEEEASYANQFASWTPRLLRAAYNYQVSLKDPGAFAHGGKYIIELLYDSIEDLGGDTSSLNRDDHGHFQGSAEAFRHWDEDGEVSASCARCHSATGLPTLAKEGVNVSAEISNGFQCSTCHIDEEFPARYSFATVTFPSGATVSPNEGDESGLCMQCHQGRQAGADVDRAVGDLADDDVMEGQRFLNVHYYAAGATRYGAEAGGGYQYADKEYAGLFPHVPGFDTCMSCHDAHELEVQTDQCFTCHAGVEDVHDIRISEVDYDGDGDVTEGIYGEIDTIKMALYEAIVAYSIENETTNQVVFREGYPYWFAANEGEDLVWTPTLLRAAYNYQYVSKDPGNFAHNAPYILQLLYDSLEAVGGDVSALTRP